MLKRPFVFAIALGLLASRLQAQVYYVNQGVKYHIGDDHASRSVDSEFLDAYPTVGLIWIQAFTVKQRDVVRVNINNVWAVDDCAYCKDLVAIDDHDMGRLFEENNHKPFHTPSSLSMVVEPGHTYLLKISSVSSGGQADDFAIEGVSIETDKEGLTLLGEPIMRNPGQPMPHFEAPKPPLGPCEGSQKLAHWLPARDRSRAQMEFLGAGVPVARRASVSLDANQFVDVYLKADSAGQGDPVDQFVELGLGDPTSAWVFSFGPGAKSPSIGNLKRAGRYVGETFSVDGWKEGDWNQLRLARCDADSMRLLLNGKQLGGTMPAAAGALPIVLRSGGLVLKAAEAPILAPKN